MSLLVSKRHYPQAKKDFKRIWLVPMKNCSTEVLQIKCTGLQLYKFSFTEYECCNLLMYILLFIIFTKPVYGSEHSQSCPF